MKYYKSVCVHGHPRADKNGIVLEHIVIAEQKLGRHLSPDEVVHHIDGNKKNNVPENLMVFASRADHTAFHHGSVAYEKNGIWTCKRINMKAVCNHCGKVFTLYYGRKIRDNLYCSKECYYADRTQVNSSVNDLINELQNANGNFSSVGRKYCVSPNAIVKILKKNGLPYHSSDYKPKKKTKR